MSSENPSKYTEIFSNIANFLRTALCVFTHPRAFFARYFQLTNSSTGSDRPIPPSITNYLGIAIGFSALVTPIHHALLRTGGFPEHFLDLAQQNWQDIVSNIKRMTGQDILLINLTQLTNIPWIDSPIEDAARISIYAIFAGLFWIFSKGQLPLKKMMGYFAYSIGACMVVERIFLLIGDLVFILLSDVNSQTSFSTMSAIHGLGYIPRLIYLFVVPAVIFPEILGIRSLLVLRTTILSVLTWGLGGLLITQIMMRTGVIIITPGL